MEYMWPIRMTIIMRLTIMKVNITCLGCAPPCSLSLDEEVGNPLEVSLPSKRPLLDPLRNENSTCVLRQSSSVCSAMILSKCSNMLIGPSAKSATTDDLGGGSV